MIRQILVAACLATALGGAAAPTEIPDYIGKAVADPTRPADDRAADANRDPLFTLFFAKVKPGMVVGELYPCGGYFSRMIADIVGPTGKVYGIDTARWKGCDAATQKVIDEGHKNFSFTVNAFGEFSLPEKVDLFWISQNYHDLHIKEYGTVDMAAFNRHVFDSLKPGGTYFVLDHQAAGPLDDAAIAKFHRIWKAQVVAEVEAAGFQPAGEGFFLNRPGDDHTKPIFDPSIRGHTDQFVLRFVKP